VPPSSAHPVGIAVRVTGSSTGTEYSVRILAEDHITDCAAHAYGAKLLTFLRAHPCASATRRLVTLSLDGTKVAMSIIAVSFPPAPESSPGGPSTYAGKFATLEEADGTGSMNDLLREGRRVPGLPAELPSGEVFTVLSQDLQVAIFDSWYVDSATPSDSRPLKDLATDLFLTPVATDN
jgi:hypothetical protein